MKLLKRQFEKDGEGFVTLLPEEQEDMWHAYNLIQEGDSLRSSTIRKVTSESATGSTSSQRVKTTLTVRVASVEYDTHAGAMHVKGRNIEENQHVKLGAYHTLDLELNRKFTLGKPCWDAIHLDRIQQACDPTQNADVAAVIMQEGLAHVCLVTSHMTIVRAKIDVQIPRKRKGSADQHDKGLQKFYMQVYQAVQRHVNFGVVKCCLVASPGFVREQFLDFMFKQASLEGNKALVDNKPKFLSVHSSSGFKHSLKEVLADPGVAVKLADTKASAEVKTLANFYEMLQNDPHRAYYGVGHVEKANEGQAIETLMISDSLFRSKDLAERKRYVNLVESVKDQGSNVLIFSSLHVSGEQLTLLSGVAAILRFPIPEIEDEEEEEHNEDDGTLDQAAGGTVNGAVEDNED